MKPLLRLQAAALRLGARHFGPYELQLTAGELLPQGGAVLLEGQPIAKLPRAALSQRRAVLPQSHGVAFGLPVSLVVGLGRVAREPDPAQREIVRDALRLAQAAHLHDRRFDTLSGGEQARVQLARVLAQLWDSSRGLLLVDEPLSALDPGLQFELMGALQSFAASRGHALVAVLHDINQALNGFDRLWLVSPESPLQGLHDDQGGLAVLMRRSA